MSACLARTQLLFATSPRPVSETALQIWRSGALCHKILSVLDQCFNHLSFFDSQLDLRRTSRQKPKSEPSSKHTYWWRSSEGCPSNFQVKWHLAPGSKKNQDDDISTSEQEAYHPDKGKYCFFFFFSFLAFQFSMYCTTAYCKITNYHTCKQLVFVNHDISWFEFVTYTMLRKLEPATGNQNTYKKIIKTNFAKAKRTPRPDFRSCLMIDLGRETGGNNEICLGVRFASCIIKVLRLARIEHCSWTVVTRFSSFSVKTKCNLRNLWKFVAYRRPCKKAVFCCLANYAFESE